MLKPSSVNNNNGTAPQFGPNLYRKLHCGNSTPASFYRLPKIHKPGRPLRPIKSSIGSPTFAVSKYLVSVLSPLRKKHLHTTKQFCFYTAKKTAFHLQQRSHGLLRCEVSVHLHTCGLSPFNNQGEATARPESSRTHQSFC